MTGPDHRGVRRHFLITIGVGDYRDSGITNLAEAPRDAHRVRELLTPMGYGTVLQGLASTPAPLVPVEIERWAIEQNLNAEDVVVVYFAGHGVKEHDRHYLLCADTVPGRWTTALASEDLARPLMSRVGHLLIMLDTCYSAAGSGDLAVLATELAPTQGDAAGRWIVASARSKQSAREKVFVDALAHTLANPQTGAKQEFLGVREVAERINDYFTEHGRQQCATYSTVDNNGREPFFPNPNYIPDLPPGDLDVATLNRLGKQKRAHFYPLGRGVGHAADRGDYFTGRTAALHELASWLRAPTHDRKARVVTGSPGSGKSALLGRLLLLTEPDHPARQNTPDLLPPAGMDIVPLYAHRATCEALTRDLAAALGRPDADRDELLGALAERTTPITVLVDALDEAGTAGDSHEGARIGRELLEPLTTLPKLRLIIGTRHPLIRTLGHAVTIIDLDDPAHISGEDIANYARDVLLDTGDPDSLSPYRGKPDLARTIGAAIAARAGTSFLVAHMTARALVHGQITVDTHAPGWQTRLPSDAGQAFATYLSQFGHANQPKVERLLRPLAYTQGAGLPWSTLWAPLAEALSGVSCPNEDVRWLQEHAGAYIVEGKTARGKSVFRLFHETMAEYLRTPNQDAAAHHAITAALLDHVPRNPVTGRWEWLAADHYILNHLATHAAAAERIDDLLRDVDYLVHADPATLGAALSSAITPDGQLTAAVYRASVHIHRDADPDSRRRLLAIDAARYGAHELVRRLKEAASTDDWWPRWATGGRIHHALRDTLPRHSDQIRAVACTEFDDRPMAVTASHDGTVRVWNLATGVMIGDPWEEHCGAVQSVACTDLNGTRVVVTGGADGTVRVWNLATGVMIGDPWEEHCGAVQSVACTDLNGTRVVVTGGADGTVRVWNLATGLVIGDPLAGHGDVSSVACARLGDRCIAVTAGQDRTVRVWDLATGAMIGDPWVGHGGAVSSVACTDLHGTPVMVTGGTDGTARAWDLTTRRSLGTLPVADSAMNVVLACTSIDGSPVAVVGDEDYNMRIWDLTTDQALGDPLAGHTHPITAIACTTIDGHPVAITGSRDCTVRVWDLDAGQSRGVGGTACRYGHTGRINAVTCTSIDARPVVVTVSKDRTARAWDLADGEPVGESLIEHLHEINAVAGTTFRGTPAVVTGSDDRTAQVSDVKTGECLGVFGRPAGRGRTSSGVERINAVACGQLGDRPVAVTGSYDGTVRFWDLANGRCLRSFVSPAVSGAGVERINAVACGQLGDRPVAVTGSHDGTARVWNLANGQPLGDPLIDVGTGIAAMALTELGDGPVALLGSFNGTMHVWHLSTGQRRQYHDYSRGDNKTEQIRALASVTLNRTPLAISGGFDGRVRIWDVNRGYQLPLGTPDWTRVKLIRTIACTQVDGRVVAVAGGDDGAIRIWDLETEEQLGELTTGCTRPIRAVACTEVDGRVVAVAGGDDGVIRIWDLRTGQSLCELSNGHIGQIPARVDGSAGRPIVTDRAEPSIKIAEKGTQTGFLNRITAVACTQVDNRSVAILGGHEGQIRIWHLEENRPDTAPVVDASTMNRITAVACDHVGGRSVAVFGSNDGMIRIWDVDDACLRSTPFKADTKALKALACTIIGEQRVVITGGVDDVVRVWDLASGQPVGEPLMGHTGSVNAIACTNVPNHPIAVTGGNDRTVRVWDLETRKCQAKLLMPAVVFALNMAADGALVVCVDRDVVVLDHPDGGMPASGGLKSKPARMTWQAMDRTGLPPRC